MMSRRPAARASRTPPRASCPITSRRSCRACLRGDNVLISAHGNSLRALVMVLEHLSPEQIVAREIATGVPLIYRLNADSTVAEKRDLAA